jgi:hypothetical protein
MKYIAIMILLTCIVSTVAIADTQTMVTGRNLDNAGIVDITNDAHNIYVDIEMNDGNLISSLAIEVGTSLKDIPQAKGNPIPGRFTSTWMPYRKSNW